MTSRTVRKPSEARSGAWASPSRSAHRRNVLGCTWVDRPYPFSGPLVKSLPRSSPFAQKTKLVRNTVRTITRPTRSMGQPLRPIVNTGSNDELFSSAVTRCQA